MFNALYARRERCAGAPIRAAYSRKTCSVIWRLGNADAIARGRGGLEVRVPERSH
jgi:hypothetical protein